MTTHYTQYKGPDLSNSTVQLLITFFVKTITPHHRAITPHPPQDHTKTRHKINQSWAITAKQMIATNWTSTAQHAIV